MSATIPRDGYLAEVGSGLSRTLNALFPVEGTAAGDGAVTFSAASWDLLLRGHRWGRWRAALLDALPFNGAGHCRDAWEWHAVRGLVVAPPT